MAAPNIMLMLASAVKSLEINQLLQIIITSQWFAYLELRQVAEPKGPLGPLEKIKILSSVVVRFNSLDSRYVQHRCLHQR